MRRKILRTALPMALVASANAQRLAKPTIDTVNHHIVRTMNSGPAAWTDTNGWKLVYERTVQPKDGSPGALGEPYHALLLADGRLIVHDEKPKAIHLYDASGRFVRNLGREGEGPGEFRDINPALFHDTLVLQDPKLARGTVMTLEGKAVRSFPTVCCQFGPPVSVDDRGRLRVLASLKGPDVSRSQWMYFDLSGKRVDSLVAPTAVKPMVWQQKTANGSTTFYVPLAPQNSYAYLHDGSILYGSTGRYELMLSRNGRDTIRIFGRSDIKPIPVSSAVRDSQFHRIVDKNERARAVASIGDIPSTYPLWGSVDEDGDGNFWVWRSTGRGLPARYDVFNRSGAFLGEVAIPFGKGQVGSWTRDHVAVMDTDADELPRIRIYRIVRK